MIRLMFQVTSMMKKFYFKIRKNLWFFILILKMEIENRLLNKMTLVSRLIYKNKEKLKLSKGLEEKFRFNKK